MAGRPKKEVEEPLEGEVLKRGPESKYRPEMCEEILQIAQHGGHIASMMVKLGIRSKDTYYRWQKEHPEFKDACEYAKIISQAYYEELGRLGAAGAVPNFNATTYALIMNNKFGEEYKRGSSGASTEINITNNTLNLSPEEVRAKIAQKIQKMKALGVDLVNYDTASQE